MGRPRNTPFPPKEESLIRKWGPQDSKQAGERWRWQHKTELDGDK